MNILPSSETGDNVGITKLTWALICIDYRCVDCRFLMSPRGVATSNHRYLPSSETRVNAGIRGRKLHLSESTWCQESAGVICFTNKWRAASLQPLKFSNGCSNAVFSNASPGLTVRFLRVNIDVFWKRESKHKERRQMSSLNLPTFLFVCTSTVYDYLSHLASYL